MGGYRGFCLCFLESSTGALSQSQTHKMHDIIADGKTCRSRNILPVDGQLESATISQFMQSRRRASLELQQRVAELQEKEGFNFVAGVPPLADNRRDSHHKRARESAMLSRSYFDSMFT